MKKNFSTSWKSSVKPRKQRKYRFNAPLHIKGKFMNVHLSKDLHKKYNVRSARVRTGDKVKIVVGQFSGKSGKVQTVNIKNTYLTVENVEIIKKDGSKIPFKINPSNVVLVETGAEDKKRFMPVEAKK